MRRGVQDGLSPKFVTRYLRATGWEKAAGNEKQSLFTYQMDGDPLELFLANSEDVRGWQSSVRDALETLSALHEKSFDDMALEVRSIIYDIVQSTIPDELVADDSIDLDVAAEFIWRSKRLLAASATAEIVKSQHFKKVKKEAQIYANTCRFGHTFRGSFGFTLESPLSESHHQTTFGVPAAIPFERKVIQRLARGLASAEKVAGADAPKVLASDYEAGWNANICDEIVKLYDAARQSRVSFNFVWSKELSPPPDLRGVGKFILSRSKIEIIQDAADILRAQDEEQQERVIGWVVELRSEHLSPKLLGPDGEIVVKWESDELGIVRVHITLPIEDYRLAIQAHDTGYPIEAKGTLKRVGRSWHLIDLISFRVIGF